MHLNKPLCSAVNSSMKHRSPPLCSFSGEPPPRSLTRRTCGFSSVPIPPNLNSPSSAAAFPTLLRREGPGCHFCSWAAGGVSHSAASPSLNSKNIAAPESVKLKKIKKGLKETRQRMRL
ncbi:uncharacterized protein LOC108335395 [Vigna angularis]|uniref:uncharacterized protein LOC108335395 n=1 Tax=Phaseolus angularis TaxID=3914 RepID=UPI0022B46D31|nr:uncharacterized protein LOC108335395 [Vigna angularis]